MKRSFVGALIIIVGCVLIQGRSAHAQVEGSVSAASADSAKFRFGRDYLRASIQYVYLPQQNTKKRSLSLTIKTQNKQGLEFKSVYDPPVHSKVDELEGIIVIDHVALNTKAPLRITQQVREQIDATRWVNLIQNFITGAASVFTGGAARSVSTLTQQTSAVNTVVSSYEQATTVVKSNDWTLFDEAQTPMMTLGNRFSAFTSPKEGFMVREEKGEPFPIHQAIIQGKDVVLFAPQSGNKTQLLDDMRTFGDRKNFPTPYAIKLSYIKAEGKAQWVTAQQDFLENKVGSQSVDLYLYPAAKTPFIILKFEKYNPYPDIEMHPECVPGVAPHFEALTSIFLNNLPPDAPTTEDDRRLEGISINKLVNTEGLRLIDTLQKLTDAGDVSLYDAGRIMNSFCTRAQKFNRGTGFMPSRLQAAARRFEIESQAVQAPQA